MSKRPTTAQLIVEGKNDRHVIWAICEQHQVAETFSVKVPDKDEGEGIDALLRSIPVRLKIAGLRALGVVVDANQNLQGRWESICHRLAQDDYENLPVCPNAGGFVTSSPNKPRVGVWLMPDNQLPGMLENFVAHLVPNDDSLASKAESCLQEIEHEGIHRYRLVHHSKAFIHTWLAWQENPGQPMGQAITTHVLQHNRPLAVAFVDWLNCLFNAPHSSSS